MKADAVPRRQFGLRSLFLVVALVALLCMGWRWTMRRLAVYNLESHSWIIEYRDGMWRAETDGLGWNPIADLAQVDYIEVLDLPNNCCSAGELSKLRACSGLRELSINSWKLSNEHFAAVAKIQQLEVLDVAGTDVSETGMCHISTLKRLRRLDLGSARIAPDAFAHLGRCSSLEELRLDSVPRLTSADLVHLQPLSKLRILTMSGLNEALRDPATYGILANMPALERCNMMGGEGHPSAIPSRAYERLKGARPNLILEYDDEAYFVDDEYLFKFLGKG